MFWLDGTVIEIGSFAEIAPIFVGGGPVQMNSLR